MAIQSIKVSWKKIGMTVPFQERVIHYFLAPKITYDDGKTKSVPFYPNIDKNDYKRLYLWDSYFVVETNRFCFIFDEKGDEKSKIPCETFGTVLWLQDDGIVCAKGTDLLRFDTDGKMTRQTPAKDFLDEEAIAWIKEDIPDAFEKIINLNLWEC